MGYKEAINEIVETLKAKYKPEKIILFGSCVWGRITRDSDIDMLIIKNTNKSYPQRWLEVCHLTRDLKRTIPFEPYILTHKEMRREMNRNLFLQEILRKGKILYEKS